VVAVLVVLGLPIALIVGAWIAARVSVRNSRLDIEPSRVTVANHRRPPVVVPLEEVDRFEPTPRVGFLAGIRPATCVLVRRDGTRIAVRRVDAAGAGIGIEALNARLATLRSEAASG
jgi:hypothetical protein